MVPTERISLDWHNDNAASGTPELYNRGRQAVDSVVHAVWKYREGLGLIFTCLAQNAKSLDLAVSAH